VRTRETWQAASSEMRQIPIVYERSLYVAGALDALELIRRTEPEIATLLVIGHNPTMSVLSAMLDEDAAGSDDGLRTAGLAVHRFEGTWAGLDARGALLLKDHTARGSRA
jgi:phosphohistidine phosphatase